MADPDSGSEVAPDGKRRDGGAGPPAADEERDTEELRAAVEEKYDFEEFGPADMAEMSGDEWEAVFDHDSWITGPELLDRVEADLRARVARRDVFATVERDDLPGGERLVAYSDEGYAVVEEDGTVQGSGTVLRDVKPSVALASMDDYEVPDVPAEAGELPSPEEVEEGTGGLGHRLLEFVAVTQVLAALVLFGAWLAFGLGVIAPLVATGFLLFGLFLFVMVANARLSDRFRAEEFRDRLRDARVESDERPPFVPAPDEPLGGGDAGAGRQVDAADDRGVEAGDDPASGAGGDGA